MASYARACYEYVRNYPIPTTENFKFFASSVGEAISKIIKEMTVKD